IGEVRRDRARGLAARELHADAFVVPQQLHLGKLLRVGVEAVIEQLRDEMRVDVDDDVLHECGPLWIASQIARCDMGSVSMAVPSGASASLTAFAIAAGPPRYPASPEPFWPNSVSGDGVQ